MQHDQPTENSTNLVISVGRTFGSGGRELGRELARQLNIAYYDKELLSRAAEGAGLSEDIFRDNDERSPHFLGSTLNFAMGFSPMSWYQTPTSISTENLFSAQSDVIRRLAAEGPCVIVGRASDYVLRDFPRLVSIFVHAPADVCVERIIRRTEGKSREKVRQQMEKTNKLRAEFYNFFTDKRWGDASGYDLCFDTSLLPIPVIASLIVNYIKQRFPNI